MALTRGTREEILEAARRLRRAMTPAEEALWQKLRAGRMMGCHFRRQHPIGPFILDFWCPEHKLAIEVDGAVHDDPAQAEYDALRTERLAEHGYTVLRFCNHDVETDLPSVLRRIARALAPP